MFGQRFYNETTRKYVSYFGTLFNDIRIYRRDNDGNIIKTMTVPISYGPYQKFLSKIQQDPDLTAPAITLPRMAFEITNMTYDGSRKLTSSYRQCATIDTDNGSYSTVLNGTPYNLDFELTIMTKYMEDGTKILEQILPFFQPEFSASLNLLTEPEVYRDVPLVLNSVSMEDTYEADYEQRRALIWTLSFTLKGWYFGPTTSKKIIKFTTTNTYDSTLATTPNETMTVQPGLTANGEPTNNIDNSIPLADINFSDDWGYIVRITNNE